MRRFRNFSIILFILSLALFIFFRSRELSLQDRSGPVISLDSETIAVSVEDPEEKLLEGLTAQDRRDGDVTSSAVVENISNFLRPGARIVRYAAFDRDMHVSRAERQMVYADYRSPEFSITQPLVFAPGNTDLLANVTVSDCLDGNLTDSIKILADEELLIDLEGEYEVRLQAANSAGDVATLPVVIKVGTVTNNAPQILLKNYVKYVDVNDDFDPYDEITSVMIGNKIYKVREGSGTYGREGYENSEVVVGTRQITVNNSADLSTPGNYRVRYSMTVKSGNEGDTVTGTATLYVVVREPQTEEQLQAAQQYEQAAQQDSNAQETQEQNEAQSGAGETADETQEDDQSAELSQHAQNESESEED